MHVFFLKVSRVMAWLGGAMLTVLIVTVCLSILGREANELLHGMVSRGTYADFAQRLLSMGIGPIRGDFELIEAGIAFSIFAFLPYCQMSDGHARVDIFTKGLPTGAGRFLAALIALVFAAVMILIAVQLFAGMESKLRSGQTTLLLEFPVWWAYAPSMLGAGVAAIVATYIAVQHVREWVTGQVILPISQGAEH